VVAISGKGSRVGRVSALVLFVLNSTEELLISGDEDILSPDFAEVELGRLWSGSLFIHSLSENQKK
jgi:ATP-dependent protease HslVU (ClpYQ) peptidase subunit